jgi:hypothetical protein
VIWVAIGIKTGTGADDLTARTRDHTLAIGADFTCFAAYAAGSAMIAVVVEIDADITAFGQTGLTRELTDASRTDFASFAGIIARAAVSAVGLGIDAFAIADH